MKKTATEKETLTYILRKDSWKLRFVALALIFFIFIMLVGIKDYPTSTSEEEFCAITNYTPSWYLENKTFLGSGITNATVDTLIENDIYFVYHSLCGACETQIKIFGNEWNKYEQSGLTIDCKEILK